MRREEVAELAGIGVDWYIRLEQGRDVNPSATTIDGLVTALRLTAAEREHLRALARPAAQRTFTLETVPPGLRALIEALTEPAYVLGRRLDVLAWNDAAAELLTDFGCLVGDDRNILSMMFCHPDARIAFGTSWSREAKRIVAQFRTAHDQFEHDPAFTELVEHLSARSPRFRQWWPDHDVAASNSGTKTIRVGHDTRSWRHSTFQSNDDPDLRLVIYTPDR